MSPRHTPLRWGIAHWSKTSSLLLGLMIPAASAKDGTGPSLTVTASETTAHPGDVVTHTITMGSVSELLSMQLQVDLPEGLTYVAGSGKLDDDLAQRCNLTAFPSPGPRRASW